MNDQAWQRARSDEQVRQRIEEILSAAEGLFRTLPYVKVTMQKIARKVGCAQSNLYRYFKSREDVFLTLYMKDMEQWLSRLEIEFHMPLSMEEFSIKFTELLMSQHRLLELAPLLNISLERNSSRDIYYQTKIEFRDKIMPRAVDAVRKALPSLSEEKTLEFLYAQQAFIAGIRPMTQFSPMQLDVLSELGMHQAMLDFPFFFQRTLLNYLRGLLR